MRCPAMQHLYLALPVTRAPAHALRGRLQRANRDEVELAPTKL
jgi:hypothetical protein